MAISGSAVWEMRTTGTQTGGAFFVTGATGTDYSQQANPQYDITDASAAGAGLTITTAAAAADMVGNGLFSVGGTNVTANKWFEIVSVVVGTSITVAGAANIMTGAGAGDVHVHIGGAFKAGGTLDDAFFEAHVAGNTCYIQSGSYTGVNAVDLASAGTAALPKTYIGYITTRTTVPTGTDRPLISSGNVNQRYYASYINWKYLRWETLGVGVYLGYSSYAYQCSFKNTSGTASRIAVGLNGRSTLIECEAACTNGYGVFALNNSQIVHCYIHDSVTGININSTNAMFSSIIGCVIDKCTTGIYIDTYYGSILYCTLYSGTTGISFTNTGYGGWLVIDNVVTAFTTGATSVNSYLCHIITNNCWNNTGNDIVNLPDDDNGVFEDPLLTAPETHDFTLQTASPCANVGTACESNVGVTGDYSVNIGAQMGGLGAGGIKIPRGMRGGFN